MTRREIVKRAVHFQNPPRVPRFWYDLDCHQDDTDVVLIPVRKWYEGPEKNEAELGFKWAKSSSDKMTMGVPAVYPLANWDDFEHYRDHIMPDPYTSDRFAFADAYDWGDKYAIADLYLSGFTGMWLLRSFDNLFADMIEEPERVFLLRDMVMNFETEIIRQCKEHGFDCVAFYDDIGMQSSMMMSPEMWRYYFADIYRQQFALCHELGMDVFYHTCGYVYPVIQDLVSLGVDILNLGQANVNGIEKVGREFRSKVCFCQPIDYQKTGLYGSKAEIYAEAKMLLDNFWDGRGGFIAHMQDYENHGYEGAVPGNTMLTRDAFVQQDPTVDKYREKPDFVC